MKFDIVFDQPKFLRRAVFALDRLFDINASLSDRMELRKYVAEFSAEQEKIVNSLSYDLLAAARLEDIYKLSLAKFMLVNYPNIDQTRLFNSIKRSHKSKSLASYIHEENKRYQQ